MKLAIVFLILVTGSSCSQDKNQPGHAQKPFAAYAYGKLTDDPNILIRWGNTKVKVDSDSSDIGLTLVDTFPELTASKVLSYVKGNVFNANELISEDSNSMQFTNHSFGSSTADKRTCTMKVKCVPSSKGIIVRVSSDDEADGEGSMNAGVLDQIRSGLLTKEQYDLLEKRPALKKS